MLTNCWNRQNRLDFGKMNLIYCQQINIWVESEKKKKNKTPYTFPTSLNPLVPQAQVHPTHLPVPWEWGFMIYKTCSLSLLSPCIFFPLQCGSSSQSVVLQYMNVPWYHLPQLLSLSWPTRSFILFPPCPVEERNWESIRVSICQPVKVNLLVKTVFCISLC